MGESELEQAEQKHKIDKFAYQHWVAERSIVGYGFLSALLPFLGYFLLKRAGMGFFCLLTLNFFFVGHFTVPFHIVGIIKDARDKTAKE